MRIHGLALALAAFAALAAAQDPAARPASPAPQTPVFEVGVDLVAVDVSVVDAQGRPLMGLQPEDFEIEVGGKPRVVASTEYLGRDLEPVSEAEQPAHYSSNDLAAPGRLVLLLVDRGNIGRGGGRQALAAADRFLGTLAPSDRVGLATVPGPGANIEFTADLAVVRQALKHVVGQATRGGVQVPLSEAIAYLQFNDRLRWDQFVGLECGRFGIANQYEQCAQQLEADARQVFLDYRERTLQSVRAIESVFLSLRGVPGPKTVILLTEGLATDSPAETRRLAEAAAEAQVTLFVLLLDTSGVDPEFRKEQLATPEERELESRSLYDLAGLSRGAVLQVIGSSDVPFQRIARELMGYYLVGFEPLPADRDGKTHEIQVRVKRDKATVRARGLVAIPTAPPTPQQAIAAALRSPLVERGLPLRVAAWARPAPGGKVRLLLAAEVARASRPVSVGFALIGASGKVAASRLVDGLSAAQGESVLFTGEAVVEPGDYALRLAAVDAAGRRGSVHRDARAAVVTAGAVLVSDLLLAAPGAGPMRPAVDLDAGASGVLALVELLGRDKAPLDGATMALDIAETADGPSLLRAPAELGPPDREGVRAARVRVAGGLLPPGPYVARATVSADGRPVAMVSRPFHVAPPAAGAAAARVPLAASLLEPVPFDRAALLAPAVLSHFMDRLAELVPGPPVPPVAAAVAEARAGRPQAIEAVLPPSPQKDDARTAFLRGVSLYASSRLDPALAELQAALRLRSDLLPAAVYMGACHAAAGRDQDAIGAWQTALSSETGTPVLYAVLADALVRVREPGEAAATLDEALAAFPSDEGLQRRQGLAHAMAGDPAKALDELSRWLESHPDDAEARLATLALLFDGFSREAAGAAKAAERERLRHHARAYIDSRGPNREVVERWLRYIDARGGG